MTKATTDSDWTLITVTYNSAKELSQYWKNSVPEGARHIVVDNCSHDETVSIARQLGAEVIALPKNIGFAKANNRALEEVTSEFVAFVNPDVEIDFSDFVELSKILRNEDAVVSPQLLNQDLSTQPNGRGLPYLADKLANRGLKLPGAQLEDYLMLNQQSSGEVDWLTGAFVAMRTTTAKELGCWNEQYFMYSEDQDLSLRAWKSGRRVLLIPSIRWVHGWKRESNSLRVKPVLRELISTFKFYASYPRLLFPWKRSKNKMGRNVKTAISQSS